MKKRLVPALLSGVCLLSGGVAVAASLATGTVTACATSPQQTIAVNGNPVTTVAGTSACTTVTYTIPTVTVTGAAPTFQTETAYTGTRPAFTPVRVVDVSTAAALKTALAGLRPGDLVKATAPFTVTGETVIGSRLAAPAELDLTGVSFVYAAGGNLPAVYLNQPTNLYVFGGDLSTSSTGGTCLLAHGGSHILWWGFSVHDCGGHGVFVTPVGAAVDHFDLEGTITRVGQNLAWDPHAEKGTGLHGALLWDSGTTLAFTNSRFAFDAHNIPVGACVEVGNGAVSSAGGNVLILRCQGETETANSQAGGSGLEVWGDTSTLGLDVKFLEVDNAQGRALDGSDVYAGQSLAGVRVEYGRANATDLNGALNEPSPLLPWYPRSGPAYVDVLPAP